TDQWVGSLTPTPYLHPCEFDSNLVSWDQCLRASYQGYAEVPPRGCLIVLGRSSDHKDA
ncbi:hypothetical protein PIB30_108189, partial [Stylosanthes scabra]|nr:hypothetical protein [Stylosanthes scabra]